MTECALRARRRGCSPSVAGAGEGGCPSVGIHLVHGQLPLSGAVRLVSVAEILGRPTILCPTSSDTSSHMLDVDPARARLSRHTDRVSAPPELPELVVRALRMSLHRGYVQASRTETGPAAGHPGRHPHRHDRRVRHRLRRGRGLAAQRSPEEHPGDHRRARPRAGARRDGHVRRRRHRRHPRRLDRPGPARARSRWSSSTPAAPSSSRASRSSTWSRRAA